MSSINSIGQSLFHYYQTAKVSAAHDTSVAHPLTQSDADGNGNDAKERDTTDLFGSALLLTLQQHGIDPDQFQHDFLAAMRSITRGQSAAPSQPSIHLNTVG